MTDDHRAADTVPDDEVATRVDVDGIEVEKVAAPHGRSAVAVYLTLRSAREGPCEVRVADAVPDELHGSTVEFHPSYDPEHWVEDDGVVVYETTVDPADETTTVYGVAVDDPAQVGLFEAEPAVEVVGAGGAEPDNAGSGIAASEPTPVEAANEPGSEPAGDVDRALVDPSPEPAGGPPAEAAAAGAPSAPPNSTTEGDDSPAVDAATSPVELDADEPIQTEPRGADAAGPDSTDHVDDGPARPGLSGADAVEPDAESPRDDANGSTPASADGSEFSFADTHWVQRTDAGDAKGPGSADRTDPGAQASSRTDTGDEGLVEALVAEVQRRGLAPSERTALCVALDLEPADSLDARLESLRDDVDRLRRELAGGERQAADVDRVESRLEGVARDLATLEATVEEGARWRAQVQRLLDLDGA